MSDYKRGKMNAEVWADRLSWFLERASASGTPLGRASEYLAVIRYQAQSPGLPPGVEFTDKILRRTDFIINHILPQHQQQQLVEFLFAEDRRRETGAIRAIYEKIGRELRK